VELQYDFKAEKRASDVTRYSGGTLLLIALSLSHSPELQIALFSKAHLHTYVYKRQIRQIGSVLPIQAA
jgi:hypothetical protein